jgi:transformation/transcription domain-associated protein
MLEIIHRFPLNEFLRPYVLDLCQLLMKIVQDDNEENAVICIKIIAELHKNYKLALEDQVQPFYDLIQIMYMNMKDAVADLFNDVRYIIYSFLCYLIIMEQYIACKECWHTACIPFRD